MSYRRRIVGDYRSGKTTMLRELAVSDPDALVVCATEPAAEAFDAGATPGRAQTFWRVAAEIVARHDRPVRILSTAEQQARIGDDHLAEAVCHYQASFLGREELRAHAHAAGVYEQWESVADIAEGYLAADEADWASVLVRASLLLRDERVLAEERERFSRVLVDDFESASFATNRLLTQLVGFDGPVVVAGNPRNAVWRHVAGSPRFLDRFARRFAGTEEVVLDARHESFGPGRRRLLVGPGGDPWLPLPDHDDEPVPVALATSLSWTDVEVSIAEHVADTPYDLDVLAGPDVPDDAYRAERSRREANARLELARSRGPSTGR